MIAEALDSAAAQSSQRAALEADIRVANGQVSNALSAGKARLDSLAASLLVSDSLMVGETIARIHMYDVYDDEVIRYSSVFKGARYQTADSVQARYQRGYDSLLRCFEERSKLEYAQLNVYKRSLRALAKYQQPGVSTQAQQQYAGVRAAFDNDVARYSAHVQEYRQAIREYSGIFTALVRLYKRQDRLANYMERAEENRKKQEERLLTKKAAFNKKENSANQALVEKSMKRAKRLAEPRTM